MPRLKKLERHLTKIFASSKPKKLDSFRKEREKAKRMAAEHGIEIERLAEGGMNVWPPSQVADTDRDPFTGDHHAEDWQVALSMVQQYAALAHQSD